MVNQSKQASFSGLGYQDKMERLKGSGFNLIQSLYRQNNDLSYEDVINKYAWALMNYVYTNAKEKFVAYLQRICAGYSLNCQRYNIHRILQTTNDKEFNNYALAFMCGFLSEYDNENNKDKGDKNE